MAAMALITDPAVVVFDEPTTALDVTTQIEVLAAFKKVVRELGTTAVYVSHDLAVVAQMADRIVVLNGGAVQENGTVGASARCARGCLHAPVARRDAPSGSALGRVAGRRGTGAAAAANSRPVARATDASAVTACPPCACSTT